MIHEIMDVECVKMEKTIEYSIKYFTAMRKTYQADSEQLSIAIDAMRKYQKIKAYMKKLEKNGQYGTLRKLKIVLGEEENGKDD